ncbi:MAG: hypothetical protein M1538_02850 [Candidatus Marsarchaeota archaeon]|jgi:hypothetical protein|nr:hypothetical protein [Candidatus Marsarchaeota archaeon]
MAYITFSKKFPGQRELVHKFKHSFNDSIIELRGKKNFDKLMKDASLKGFDRLIIIERIMNDKKYKGIIIKIEVDKERLKWEYGREFKILSINDLANIKE